MMRDTKLFINDVREICGREDLSTTQKIDLLLSKSCNAYKDFNIDFKVDVVFGNNQGAESIKLFYGHHGFYIEFAYDEVIPDLLGFGEISPQAVVKFDLR
jgi:hypothetical protein